MKYSTLTTEDIEVFSQIVGCDRCLSGDKISEDYSHDELGGIVCMPQVVLYVYCTDEVSRIMKYASKRKLPVVVRGSGTGLVGGAVPVMGGVLLDTTKMNKILELDKENFTVTVQPGVLLMELAEFAISHDLMYPPDPGEKSATIGGNISTNAGGMRAVKYGVTRDYVRGLTVVLPNGEVMTVGGKVVKNSSGYAWKDLIIGSEGTLAVITEAVLKLVPLPTITVSLLVPFNTMDDALDIVPTIIQSKVSPTAIEYMSREVILMAEEYLGKRFPDTKAPAYILLTFDGTNSIQIETEYSKVADLCLAHGALDAYIVDTDERKRSVWDTRSVFLEAIKASTMAMDECDVVVPRSHIADYIKFTHAIADEFEMRIPSFGHAGDGNLHIYLCQDHMTEEQFHQKCTQIFTRMYDMASEMGGQVSGEHGIGFAKKDYLARQISCAESELMMRIKAAFDPNHILNPCKIYNEVL